MTKRQTGVIYFFVGISIYFLQLWLSTGDFMTNPSYYFFTYIAHITSLFLIVIGISKLLSKKSVTNLPEGNILEKPDNFIKRNYKIIFLVLGLSLTISAIVIFNLDLGDALFFPANVLYSFFLGFFGFPLLFVWFLEYFKSPRK